MHMINPMNIVNTTFKPQLLVLPIVILLSACAYSPNEYVTRDPLPKELIHSATPQTIAVDTDWWLRFDSPQLNALMRVLDAQNLTLDTARIRLERAQLQLKQAGADSLPSVRARAGTNSSRNLDTATQRSSSSGGVSVAYEIDIWGSRAASQLASRLNVDVNTFTLRSSTIQIQNLLAQEYFNLLSLQQRQAIAQQNVNSAQQLFNLIDLRFKAGSASGIEVAQQQNIMLSAQSALATITNAIKVSNRVIAVLCNDSQMQTIDSAERLQLLTLPKIDLIQPASVLAKRPDVAAARTNLKLADIELYQTSIAGLPGLSFGADLTLSDLLDLANGWSIGGALSSAATLFDGGKLKLAEDIASQDVKIALNSLKSVTLSATKELLDGLDNLEFNRQIYALNKLELANNKQLYELAQFRYKSGQTDFLTLLNAQRSWFNAQLVEVNSYRQLLTATLDVYRAAGGVPYIVDASNNE